MLVLASKLGSRLKHNQKRWTGLARISIVIAKFYCNESPRLAIRAEPELVPAFKVKTHSLSMVTLLLLEDSMYGVIRKFCNHP